MYVRTDVQSSLVHQSMDDPCKVDNPARGHLNRECIFPSPRSRLRIWSRETGSAVPSRVSPLITDGILPDFRHGAHLLNRHISSGQSRVYRGVTQLHTDGSSLPRVRRHSASNPQGSCSNGCCLVRNHHGPTHARLYFPTPTRSIGTVVTRDYFNYYRRRWQWRLL